MIESKRAFEMASVVASDWQVTLRRQIANAILEARAQEAEWWVADLELGGIEFDGDNKHLKRRADELREQKDEL